MWNARWARAVRWLAAVVAASAALIQSPALGKDADLVLGGPGAGKGTFARILDITFDARGILYVLDGGPFQKRDETVEGNFLVQKFDGRGRFVSQFSVHDEQLGERNDPARLAVDSRGNVYVTQPKAGVVQQFSPDGKLLRRLDVPNAFAIAVHKTGEGERVLVAPRPGGGEAIDRLAVLQPTGAVGEPLKLTRKLTRCSDLAIDAGGSVYAQADTRQVHKFDAVGRHRLTIGAGTTGRLEDGSELWHSVAVDPAGNVYSLACGWIARFDAAVTSVTRRQGKFTWYDPWIPHAAYTMLAVDPTGRLWVATSGHDDGKGRYHRRPVVLRTAEDFFGKKAETHSALLLGLNAEIVPRLPYHVGCHLEPVTVDFVVKPGVRRVHDVSVAWGIRDVLGAEAAAGRFDLKLVDGQEARRAFTFTPRRWGWYTIEVNIAAAGRRLVGIGAHLGLTPAYPHLPLLKAGQSPGGWEDPLRQAFVGLPLLRVHPRPGQLDKLEKVLADCARHGVTPLAQFTGKKEATHDFVARTVTRFKGRIRHWEIINEPNFSFSPAEYVTLCGRLYPLIKAIDPSAKVLAPAVCGVQLPWYRAFYERGGHGSCDILSVHDYEGHESIDPFHWRRKFGDLRRVMRGHRDADKPIWQTERGMPGVRADCFLGPAQAVRELLHRNLLASFGIPSEHSVYYYLNHGGYGAYPAYLWSRVGPHPAALALRTRRVMLMGRKLAERIDLGTTGSKCLLALRYAGGPGQVITLQSLGTLDWPMELPVSGGESLAVVDAFGNEQAAPVRSGKARVTVGALPIYLRLAEGQKVTIPKLDLGRNLAPLATFSYSGKLKHEDTTVLANGVFESPHAGYPTQYRYLEGEITSFPQYLNITFPHPRTVDRMLVFSLRADNMQTALLDYDVEAHVAGRWTTVCRTRTPMPASSAVLTPQCKANTWYMDTNFFRNEFRPVTAHRLRLVVRNTTRGLLPDAAAERITGRDFGPRLHLREIEIYGPPGKVEVSVPGGETACRQAVERRGITAWIVNRTAEPLRVEACVSAPRGWTARPARAPVTIGPRTGVKATFDVQAPAPLAVGPVPIDVEVRDPQGRVLDYDRLTLTFLSPVELTPRAPQRLDGTAQPMRLDIRNLAHDSDVTGTARVCVSALEQGDRSLEPPAKAFGPVQPGQTVTVEVPVRGLKLLGRPWRVAWSVTARGLIATASEEWAPVRAWHVVGPFANDEKNTALHTAFAPERGVDLSAPCDLAGGKKGRWRLAVTDGGGYVELAKRFERNTFACAYAFAIVRCPTARDAVVSVGWDDGFRLFLNGTCVAEDDSTSHGAKPGQLRVPVRLKAGDNEVLLKVTQFHGGWGFYFRVLGPDGKPMGDAAILPDRSP